MAAFNSMRGLWLVLTKEEKAIDGLRSEYPRL